MSYELSLLLAVLFLAAIPVNAYAVKEFRKEAGIKPRIPGLTLNSRLVNALASVAVVVAIVTSASVFFLATGVRVIPMPVAIGALVVVLLMASFANVFAVRYLRGMRRS